MIPTGKPPPLAVRLAKALPFRRASIEMRDSLIAHDDLHTADSAHACARLGIYSDHMARQGRRYGTYAMAAGMLQGLQALSARQWPPLGAFIKLPALRVVHDFATKCDKLSEWIMVRRVVVDVRNFCNVWYGLPT